MKTTKPIATISYLKPDYLKTLLDGLVKAHVIEFYAFVHHRKEADEKKDHSHVFISPARSIQTMDLQAKLIQFDPENPEKPLRVLPFVSSKFDDWYLYAIHDRDYLAFKQQSRLHHYRREDVVTNDDDFLDELISRIDRTFNSPVKKIRQAQASGVTFIEFLANGQIPIQQVAQWSAVWSALLNHEENETRRHSLSSRHEDVETDKAPAVPRVAEDMSAYRKNPYTRHYNADDEEIPPNVPLETFLTGEIDEDNLQEMTKNGKE